jgi:uncharacterized protein (TIGR02246 family)
MTRRRPALLLAVLLLSLGSTTDCRRHREREARARLERMLRDRTVEAEASIRAATIAWSKASVARDLDKAVSFYADDAVMFPDKQPKLEGKADIRKGWQQSFEAPGPGLSFATTKVDVAHSADMAWESGTYDFAIADKKGKVTHTIGKYVVVWKKQFDGAWKVVADIDNHDQ